MPLSARTSGDCPPISPDEWEMYAKIFQDCCMPNGLLPGTTAIEVFGQSKLMRHELAQVWDLVDLQSRGALIQTEFIVAMHIIRLVQSTYLAFVPESVPSFIWDQAAAVSSNQPPAPSPTPSPPPLPTPPPPPPSPPPPSPPAEIRPTTKEVQSKNDRRPLKSALKTEKEEVTQALTELVISEPNIRQVVQTDPPPTLPVISGTEVYEEIQSISTQLTTEESVPSRPSSKNGQIPEGEWKLSPEDLDRANLFFDMLDIECTGYIDGGTASRFFTRSKLTYLQLAEIWNQADANADGQLSRMEFAVAMFLIRQKVDEERVPAEEFAIANKIYDMLDVWDNGYIDTETAISFFMKSRLPGYELEEIWDIADSDCDGRFTRREFAKALHMIREKLNLSGAQ